MADPELVLCAPCQSTGESLPAVKFCITCGESLCRTCVEFHMKFRSTKSHKLVDCSTQDISHFKGAQLLSAYMVCPNHDDSSVKVRCEEHNAICCLTCATVAHRNCRHVSEINTLAVGCKTSGQTGKIRARLEGAGLCMQEIIDINDDCRRDFKNSKEEIPKKLEKIKITLMKLFETIESTVMEKVKSLHIDEDIATGNREENWKLKLNRTTSLLQMLDTIIEIGNESQVFVALHKMTEILSETETALEAQGNHILGRRLNLKITDKFKNVMHTDLLDNLVYVETVPNQYQLLKTSAHLEHLIDYETKLTSDSFEGDGIKSKLSIPGNVSFDNIEGRFVDFVKKSDSRREAVQKRLDSCHAKVIWPEKGSNIVIECQVSEKTPVAKNILNDWQACVEKNLMEYFDQISCNEHVVCNDAWDAVLEGIREIYIDNPDAVALYLDKKEKIIRDVGYKRIVESVSKMVDKVIKDVSDEIERRKQTRRQTSLQPRMLLASNYPNKMEDKFPI